jgi:ATP-dependent Clp protease ATP-binding subunit ClpA
MFERFTEQSRRVVVLAQEESRMLRHNYIGTEHLLLGMLHAQGGTATNALASAGITIEAARSQVRELAGPGDELPSGYIPFTQRAKKVLELSLREALEQSKSYIGTEHILLALIRDADATGARVLERLGVSLPALRQQVLEQASTAAPGHTAHEEAEHRMWARDWPHAQVFTREGAVPRPGAIRLRHELTPIDQRLARIERQLGIAAEEEPADGGRELLISVHRRLTNIARHLGITPEAESGEAGQAEAEE